MPPHYPKVPKMSLHSEFIWRVSDAITYAGMESGLKLTMIMHYRRLYPGWPGPNYKLGFPTTKSAIAGWVKKWKIGPRYREYEFERIERLLKGGLKQVEVARLLKIDHSVVCRAHQRYIRFKKEGKLDNKFN